MTLVDGYPPHDRAEFIRWSACAAAVLAVHAIVVAALAARSDYADLEAGAPVVMLELSPIPIAAPAPPTDLAPGPLQPSPEAQERLRQEAEPKPPDPEPMPEAPPAVSPAVSVPPPEPKPKEKTEAKVEQKPVEAAPVPTAPIQAETPAPRPASPALGTNARTAAAEIASWQRALVAQLQRHKRYPPHANGERGVASIEFTVDRRGHVVSSKLVRSSGSAVLDAETLALIRRADPFPPPPPGLADSQLSFLVLIRYAVSATR